MNLKKMKVEKGLVGKRRGSDQWKSKRKERVMGVSRVKMHVIHDETSS